MRRNIALFLIGICPFLFWYGQNFWMRTTVWELRSPVLAAPVNIVQLSDLHGINYGHDNADLVRQIAELQPDLICITGDMYTRGDASGRETAISLIRRLCELSIVCFVPGEHDRESGYLRAIADCGALLPDEQGVPLAIHGTALRIYGCPAAWFPPECDLSARYRNALPDEFAILLCHIPRPDAFMDAGIDLMLSGDSHGGLMRLPLLGPIYADGQWFPFRLDDQPHWIAGAYDLDGMTLWVSAGMGGAPVRLCNPPEICLLRLLPAEDGS